MENNNNIDYKKEDKKAIIIAISIFIVIFILVIKLGQLIPEEEDASMEKSNNSNDIVEEKLPEDEESSGTKEPSTIVEYKSDLDKKRFVVLEDYFSNESNRFVTYIEGKIQNNSDQSAKYIMIEFSIYDSENNKIGTCNDYSSSLEPNGIWKFKAICTKPRDEIAYYELSRVSGR